MAEKYQSFLDRASSALGSRLFIVRLAEGTISDPTPGQQEALKGALYDAIEYRREYDCADCDKFDGPCEDHRADDDLAGSYQALANDLGIDLEG